MAKQVQVVATARGFDNLTVREPGEKFELDEEVAKKGAKWFKVVGEKSAAKPAAKKDEGEQVLV